MTFFLQYHRRDDNTTTRARTQGHEQRAVQEYKKGLNILNESEASDKDKEKEKDKEEQPRRKIQEKGNQQPALSADREIDKQTVRQLLLSA